MRCQSYVPYQRSGRVSTIDAPFSNAVQGPDLRWGSGWAGNLGTERLEAIDRKTNSKVLGATSDFTELGGVGGGKVTYVGSSNEYRSVSDGDPRSTGMSDMRHNKDACISVA